MILSVSIPEFSLSFSIGIQSINFSVGVGLTTPPLPVFSSKVEAGAYFAKMNIAANASHSSIGELHAQMDLFGSMAKHHSGHISEYVSTPLVAQDMLSIVKAYGQTKLQYWGFS